MNPMFNEYKDAGKIQEALLIGRNMVNKAPGDSECVNAYLDFLLMLAEKLPRTDERKSFADQANLVLSFYEENADLTDDIINDIHVYHKGHWNSCCNRYWCWFYYWLCSFVGANGCYP